MYVCMCKGVTDREIRQAVANGDAFSLRCLREQMGVASECGCCAQHARACVRDALSDRVSDSESLVPHAAFA